MLRFLERILASQGLRCGVSIDAQKRVSQRWFRTNQELESYLLDASELTDAYHCNATFSNPGSRKKSQDCLYKSVWIDIDQSFEVALASLASFKPVPNIIVSSGGGLHAYWIFTRDLSLDEWEHASRAFQACCSMHGLGHDSKCTIDAVRILRPPGTLNYKYDPRPTIEWCETGVADYEYESFLSDVLASSGDRGPSISHRPGAVRDGRKQLDLIPVDHPPANADQIAEFCSNMEHFKDTGCQSDGEEPLWKACLGVLAFADNGYDVAQRWSGIDPRYNASETDKKFHDRKKNQTGASLCRQFEDETDLASRARCNACRFHGKVNSPINLGYGDVDISSSRKPNSECIGTIHSHADDVRIKRAMPDGYHIGSGVHVNTWGDRKDVPITVFPLYFLERTQGEPKNSVYYDVWEHQAKHSVDTIRVKAGTRNYAGELEEKGVILWNSEPLRGYISACQKMEAMRRDRTMHYGCFGWKNNDREFLWGSILFRVGARENITIIDRSLDDRSVYLRPGGKARRGNLAAWKSNITGLLQPGFEVQQLALLASVGAIFIHFLAPTEGGAILHFVNKSGTGKTTALKVAASVWGDLDGLSSTLDDTATSKSIKFGYLRHLPLIFDELTERDPAATERLIRTFTVGTDKSRALVDGSGLQENNREWSTILISAANRSIVDTVNLKSRSAMAQRVLEFQKEFPTNITLDQRQKGQKYANEVAANCGWAGEVILKAIFEDETRIDALQQALENAFDELSKELPGWNQERRYWLRALASMQVAGALMHGMELIDFDYNRAIKWACFELDNRNSRELREQTDPVEALSHYLDSNIHVTLFMAGAWMKNRENGQFPNITVEGYKLPAREVYIRREVDTNTILIDKVHFKRWLTENDHYADPTLDRLELKKIIMGTERITLSAGTELQSGQKACLRVNGNRLSSPEPAA